MKDKLTYTIENADDRNKPTDKTAFVEDVKVMGRKEYQIFKGWDRWGSMQEQNYDDYLFYTKEMNK